MRRIWRGVLVALGLLVIVGLVAVLAARRYLASPAVAARVTTGLEAQYGAPVEVGQVHIGLEGSSVGDLKLYEADALPGEEPWATFQNVHADVSLASLVRGTDRVRNLDVTGADLTLRFDYQGRLLTRFPTGHRREAPLPSVHLHNSRITLAQQGRHPFVVNGIDAEIRSADGRLELTGTVKDPHWGDWSVSANLDPTSGASDGTLKSATRLHVTEDMLEDLPFVSPSVWASVQAEGDTPVEFSLRYEPDTKAVHYRVALDPENTHVHVTAIDLTADQARGKVTIADAVVKLEKVRGHFADGTLGTDATLDFAATPNQLAFNVNASGLDLVKLPKLWKVPPQLTGHLTGHAELVVRIVDGHAHTSGEGQGEITDARVWGMQSHPIRLRLYSEGTGFRFGTPRPVEAPRSGAVLPRAVETVVLLSGAERDPVFAPGEAAGRAARGVLDAVGGAVAAGERALRAVPKRARGLPGGTPVGTPAPSYLEAHIALDNVDLEKLVGQLKMRLPVPVTGQVSVDVRVAFPIDTPEDVKAYRLHGTARSPRLAVAGVELRQLRAKVNYDNGVLHFDDLDGQVPAGRPTEEGTAAGTFRGTARLDVSPPGEATASLILEHVPLDRALALIPGPAPRAAGTVSGTVAARAPARKLEDVTAWTASGHLDTDRLEAYGLTLANAHVDVGLDRGDVSLSNLSGKLAGATINGSGGVSLTEHHRYRARLDVKGADLAAAEHLVPDLRPGVAVGGSADVHADVDGTLSPLAWKAKGTASARQLVLDTLTAQNVKFHWDTTPDRVEVSDLSARLYHGDVTGSATVPLGRAPGRPEEGGKAEPGKVNLDFKDLDVGAFIGDLLTAATPARQQTGGRRAPVPVQGQADGTLTATIPPGGLAKDKEINAKVDLRSSRLRVQGLLTEKIRGNIRYTGGVFEYSLEGSMAGGTIKLEGKAPSRPRQPNPPADRPPEVALRGDVILVQQPADQPGGGRLRVEGAQLSRLFEQLGIPAERMPLRGTLDIDLPYTQESIGAPPTGTGTVTIRRLRWQREELTGELRTTVRLTPRALELTNLSAIVGQGVLRGRALLPLRAGERGWFSAALEGVEARRLLAPWPDLAARVEGPMTITVRGTTDHEWSGSGQVVLLRGRVAGVEVVDARLPIDFVIAPRRGAGQVEIRDSSALVALGRVTGRATVYFDSVNRLDGEVRFSGVDLPTLLRGMTEQGQVGPGKVTGRIDFAANDLRSLDDVSATVAAKLQQTQTLNYPVLQQLTPFLPRGQSSGTFSDGDLRGRLDRGVFRVQRLSLRGSNLQLFIDGTVTLEQRLNLDVTANTGQYGVNPRFLTALGLRIPAIGPVPVSLLLEASTYLSNRTVHLRVGGTIRSPTVQVEPVSLLSEEAVRFFINRTPLPIP